MKNLLIITLISFALLGCSKEDRREVKQTIDSASNTINKELDTLVNSTINKDSVFENTRPEAVKKEILAGEDLRKKLNDIFDRYEDIKDELTDDDTSGVLKRAVELEQAIIRAQRTAAANNPDSKWKLWLSGAEKITAGLKLAEQLSKQRALFSDLTASVKDMITQFGLYDKTIYELVCSKINKRWFTESKNIDNPYYGNDEANQKSNECAKIDKAWKFE